MTIERKTDEWGRVILDKSSVFEAMYNGFDVWDMLVEDHEELKRFNSLCMTYDHPELVIETPEQLDHSPEEEHKMRAERWFISDDTKNIDVESFLLSKCETDLERNRVEEEMLLYKERHLIPLLQLMIYLTKYFKDNKIVKGVGRGSSVSSFVLYLIGIHKINSLKYDLSIHDFLK